MSHVEDHAPADATTPGEDDGPHLTLTIVEYADRRDRATLAPADPAPNEECTAWLTVNRSVLRALDEMR